MQLTLPLVLTTGLLDSLNPCAISLLLLYISLMFTLKQDRKKVLLFGLVYIISIYITYLLLGIFFYNILGFLTEVQSSGARNYISGTIAVVTIIFGLLNIKEYFFPNAPIKIRIPFSVRQKASDLAYKGTLASAVLIGVIVGIAELPCSGSIYFAIIDQLERNETLLSGLFYLALYNIMFILPLILILIFSANKILAERMINIQERLGRKLHLVLAAVMIGLGAGILYLIK